MIMFKEKDLPQRETDNLLRYQAFIFIPSYNFTLNPLKN